MGEMRDSDWSRENLLRSDWLPIIVAPITTCVCSGIMANLEFYLHYRLGHSEQFNTANMK